MASEPKTYTTGDEAFSPFPTAHLFLCVRRPLDDEQDIANERVDQARLNAAAEILKALDQLGWRVCFDYGDYIGEGYIEWMCMKRFATMDLAHAEVASLPRITLIDDWYGVPFTGQVNDGEGNSERSFRIDTDPPEEAP